jgi:transposase-like protein
VDIENRYRMIIEPERSGKTISDVCIAYGVSREIWYKWNRRYDAYGIGGLKDQDLTMMHVFLSRDSPSQKKDYEYLLFF